jgi:hypothetical protein
MDISDTTERANNQPGKTRNRGLVTPTYGIAPANTEADIVAHTDTDAPAPALATVRESTLKTAASTAISARTASPDKALSAISEWTVFNLETLAALTEASDILVLGSHDLLQQARQSGQAAFDESLSGFRAIASANTVEDSVELQVRLIRSSLSHSLSESRRFMLASLELAAKASAPLTDRATVAAEKLGNHAV